MVQATSSSIIAAAQDRDIAQRLVAVAAQQGVDDPQQVVASNLHRLILAPVSEGGDTIASVLEYARATYVPTPLPGANPAAVTDAFLSAALTHVLTPVDPAV